MPALLARQAVGAQARDRRPARVASRRMTALFLVLLLALASLLGAIAYGVWSARGVPVDESAPVGAGVPDASALLDQVGPTLGEGGFRIVPGQPGVTVLERVFHPWWTIVLAVCLFPLGLLFLLVRGRHVISVSSTSSPDGRAAVRVQGRATTWARDVTLGALRA